MRITHYVRGENIAVFKEARRLASTKGVSLSDYVASAVAAKNADREDSKNRLNTLVQEITNLVRTL